MRPFIVVVVVADFNRVSWIGSSCLIGRFRFLGRVNLIGALGFVPLSRQPFKLLAYVVYFVRFLLFGHLRTCSLELGYAFDCLWILKHYLIRSFGIRQLLWILKHYLRRSFGIRQLLRDLSRLSSCRLRYCHGQCRCCKSGVWSICLSRLV